MPLCEGPQRAKTNRCDAWQTYMQYLETPAYLFRIDWWYANGSKVDISLAVNYTSEANVCAIYRINHQRGFHNTDPKRRASEAPLESHTWRPALECHMILQHFKANRSWKTAMTPQWPLLKSASLLTEKKMAVTFSLMQTHLRKIWVKGWLCLFESYCVCFSMVRMTNFASA